MCAVVLLGLRNYSFWTRPEPLQLLCMSTALVVALNGRGAVAAMLLGGVMGVFWGLKITGPMYSLPVFAIFWFRSSSRAVLLAVLTSIAATAVPFVAWSNVSFENYLAFLRVSGGTGFLLSSLRQNIEWASYLSVPMLLAYYAAPNGSQPQGRELRVVALAFGAALCGVVLAASRPGGFANHLLPFLPIVFHLVARYLPGDFVAAKMRGDVSLATTAFVSATVLIVLAQQAQFVTTMAERRLSGEVADITEFANSHPGVVEMGYGADEVATLARPVLVFRNNTYALDQPAIRDYQLAGFDLPSATIEALRSCRVRYWLIPKGYAPFSSRNTYSAMSIEPVFSEQFRQAFAEMYALVATTRYYDVWECRHRRAP